MPPIPIGATKLLHLRLPGVLQRIAICYLAGGLLTLYGALRSQHLPCSPHCCSAIGRC
ncbi:MAG: hypothetical protein WDN69_28855 [Aliidongia sp.]